jgi:4-hydroxybenzoate polyprenyltransferase
VRLRSLIQLLRLQNAAHPLLAIIAGYVVSGGDNVASLGCSLVLFTIVHSLVTIWNDIEDKDVDHLNGRSTITELYSNGRKHDVTVLMVVLITLSIALSIFAPSSVVLWCLAFVLVGWLYNARPIQASRRPIASMLMMWLGYGVVPFALGASFGEMSIGVAVLGLGWSLSRVSLSLLKDFKDATGDAKANKRTFLLVYGKSTVVRISLFLAVVGLGSVIIVLSFWVAWYEAVVLAIFAWLLVKERTLLTKEQTYRGLNRIFHQCLRYQLVFDGAVLVCLIT